MADPNIPPNHLTVEEFLRQTQTRTVDELLREGALYERVALAVIRWICDAPAAGPAEKFWRIKQIADAGVRLPEPRDFGKSS